MFRHHHLREIQLKGCRCRSELEDSPGTREALHFIPSTEEEKEEIHLKLQINANFRLVFVFTITEKLPNSQ